MPLVRPPQSNLSPSTPQSKPQLPPFGPCPRSAFVSGHNDWLDMAPIGFPEFELCPDCFKTSFKNTPYGSSFTPGPPKQENILTRCDFSYLWIRIAYAWLYTQNQPSLALLGGITRLKPDQDGPCPNLNEEDDTVKNGGRAAVTRSWYCLYDPSTRSLVEDITVCSDCVAHINFILPGLKDIFQPVANGQKLLATCDLMTIGDEQARYLEYMDRIINVAEEQTKTGHLDVSPLVQYIKKWAAVPVCKKSKSATTGKEFTFKSLGQDFTSCEECYIKYIEPLLTTTPLPILLSELQTTESTVLGFTCDMYSPRLQGYFKEACQTNDIVGYRKKLLTRSEKWQELNMQLGRMRQEQQQLQQQASMSMQMMQMAQASAMNTSLAWTISSRIGPPTDFSAAQAHLAQSGQLQMQAAQLQDKIALLEREWAEYWE